VETQDQSIKASITASIDQYQLPLLLLTHLLVLCLLAATCLQSHRTLHS